MQFDVRTLKNFALSASLAALSFLPIGHTADAQSVKSNKGAQRVKSNKGAKITEQKVKSAEQSANHELEKAKYNESRAQKEAARTAAFESTSIAKSDSAKKVDLTKKKQPVLQKTDIKMAPDLLGLQNYNDPVVGLDELGQVVAIYQAKEGNGEFIIKGKDIAKASLSDTLKKTNKTLEQDEILSYKLRMTHGDNAVNDELEAKFRITNAMPSAYKTTFLDKVFIEGKATRQVRNGNPTIIDLTNDEIILLTKSPLVYKPNQPTRLPDAKLVGDMSQLNKNYMAPKTYQDGLSTLVQMESKDGHSLVTFKVNSELTKGSDGKVVIGRDLVDEIKITESNSPHSEKSKHYKIGNGGGFAIEETSTRDLRTREWKQTSETYTGPQAQKIKQAIEREAFAPSVLKNGGN